MVRTENNLLRIFSISHLVCYLKASDKMNKVLDLFLSLWLLTIHNFQLPLKFPIKTIIKKTPYKERWFTSMCVYRFVYPK